MDKIDNQLAEYKQKQRRNWGQGKVTLSERNENFMPREFRDSFKNPLIVHNGTRCVVDRYKEMLEAQRYTLGEGKAEVAI